ncbi:MAG TPA: glycosyltransferase family 1 protein [Actinomycetota bacterium]
MSRGRPALRVAVDARPGVSAGMTGIGIYTRELLRHLPRVDPRTTYLAWYLNARAALRPWRPPRFFEPAPNLVERWTPFPSAWWERLAAERDLPRVEWFVRFDVLFAPNFIPPPTRSRRVVLTVHDLAFRRFPETAPHATRRWLGKLDDALRRAAHVIVPSQATRDDLVELASFDADRVTVVPHGVDRGVFRPPADDEVARVRRRFGIDGPYLVFIGGLEPRKNLPRLLRAFAEVPGDVRLVVAGAWVPWNPEGVDQLRPVVDALPPETRARLVFPGYVGERDKVALLGGAEALAYPSRYEGFGLPVLEAMAVGTPVLTSTVSSLPEVAGDAAVLVDPDDEGAIAEGMTRLLSDRELAASLRAAGLERAARFSWDETAKRTATVLHLAARG